MDEQTERPWKVRDVVKLISGGPPMTVTAVYLGVEAVECTWFATDLSEPSVAIFVDAALTLTSPRP
jgi:uncharacterized protein YodC (DUF2158 family)